MRREEEGEDEDRWGGGGLCVGFRYVYEKRGGIRSCVDKAKGLDLRVET